MGNRNKPIVVDGLVCTDTPALIWADGEHERWAARAAALDHGRQQPDWPMAVTSANRMSDLSPAQISWLIAKGPDGPARALLADPPMLRHRQRIDLGRVALARFGLDAMPFVLSEAGQSADVLGLLILPLRAKEAAALAASWLRHLGSARLWARLWLARHPEAAARALIPAATGRPGKTRQNAEDALRLLTASGHTPLIQKTTREYGHEALAALVALLGPAMAVTAPEDPRPLPSPTLPGLGDAAVTGGGSSAGMGAPFRVPSKKVRDLPELRRADGGVMPEDEVAAVAEALTRSRPADPPEPPPGDPDRPGLPLVVESSAARQPLVAALDDDAERLLKGCDQESLTAFGRTLLDRWLTDGMPAADAWVLVAQAHIGDDTTMEQLGPLIRSWPAKSRYARAIDGYAVLATVGSDVALRHLLAIEANMSGGSTNDRALDYLTQAAARRGLTPTQLADRLAITHGLDAGLVVDYGSRRFPVVVDEHLTPHVTAPDGRILARPPKPGVKDAEPGAYQWFLQFKKDLRATAVAQTARLEREMHRHRLRPARDLTGVLLPHPILGPIARRLLWGAYDGGDRLVQALRVAEDGSLADVHDSTVTVDGDTPLGIVHPAELGAELPEWAQLLADYEILQPFPQVNRPSVVLTEEQKAATSLPGFGPVSPDAIEEMLRGRWYGNGYETGNSIHTQMRRSLPGGLTLLVELDPGVSTSTYLNPAGEQRITEIWVDDTWSDHWQSVRRTTLGSCDPAALSELLVDLYALGR
ncbi:hypothetical protein Q0Z83_066470 [Actinoplanes sichuanensis]|uniref:DUF4132 domain-containing protein n=1 Tax=Actinoplanes sichuanensis TaxID=512349 RepID=A0ABW4AN12_9ACTN|nr:DUF4132 domain-containing protein [Actinoplanes sichuanensis]BEL08456.1 hypothetical protein Q0Z83_066470 [Actinoplanes sichuanensis]